MMELVDMNSLGLFNFLIILSVQVGFTLYYTCSLFACILCDYTIYKNKIHIINIIENLISLLYKYIFIYVVD